MRIILIVLLMSFWVQSYGQIERESPSNIGCEELTSDVLLGLEEAFETRNLDSFERITENWISTCGTSEFAQRCIIMEGILTDEPVEDAISAYFEYNMHRDYSSRQYHASQHDFGYIYSENSSSFDYVPLRHILDTLISSRAQELLEGGLVFGDEKLICILFSKGQNDFYDELSKHENRDTRINQYLKNRYKRDRRYSGAYTLYAGVSRPLNSDDVFGANPVFGASISTPLEYKIVVELGVKVRVNVNDKPFDYYAMGEVNEVDSDYGILIGTTAGYKVFDNEKFIVLSKAGVGVEIINTGLSESKEDCEEDTYYDLEMVHLTAGIAVMTPVFKSSNIGMGLNYHFCPYGLEKKLKTPIENNLVSTELFFRF